MAKKLRSWRALSCILAVLAAIAFIVACGDGKLIDIHTSEIGMEIDQAEQNFDKGHLLDILDEVKNRSSSSSEESPSSSSEEENKESSSSEGGASTQSSSSTSRSSSSSTESQRSSSSPYTLSCSVIGSSKTIESNTMGYTSSEIANWIKIECKDNKGASKELSARGDVETWTDAPNWSSTLPKLGESTSTWSSMKIKTWYDLDNDKCPNKEVTCTGSITVRGEAITTSSASNNTTSSSSRGSNTTSSASNTTSSASNTTTSSASGGGYCFYGPGKCYTKPTAGCDEYSVEVSNCDNPSGIRYCDYGVCENGSGDGCDKGGCYLKVSTCNTGATEVTTCPNDHLPPNARSSGSTGGGGSSSSGSNSGGSCTVIANDTATNLSTNSCVSAPDACSGKAVKVGYWNGSNTLELKVSGACTKTFSLTKGNYADLGCNGKVDITVTSGNATDFKIGCW